MGQRSSTLAILAFEEKRMAKTTVVKIEIKNRKVVKNYDVYIGRRWNLYGFTEDSPWHNPYKEGRDGTLEEVLEKYRARILGRPDLLSRLHELAGKRLGCWCAPDPCHGEILLQLLAERGLIDV